MDRYLPGARDQILGELKLRVRMGILTAQCFAGASAMALAISWLRSAGFLPWSYLLSAIWFVVTVPWLVLVVAVVSDLVLVAMTGRTMMLPLLLRLSSQDEEMRKLASKPSFEDELGHAHRAASFVGLYANPIAPLLLSFVIYLVGKPPMESVDELLARVNQRRIMSRVGGDIGRDVRHQLGPTVPA